LKPEKCFFEKPSIEYLGMIISQNKIQMDPTKLSAVLDWPTPKCVKDVQSFLGFGKLLSAIHSRIRPYHGTTHFLNPERHHMALGR